MEIENLSELVSGSGDEYKILEKIFDDKKIFYISELSGEEIKKISIILFLSEYLDLPDLKKYVYYVLKLKVSKNRKGRIEFLEGFKEIKKSIEEKLKQENKPIM